MRIDIGGHRIYFEVLGAKLAPTGPEMVERPTVVCLHGGPGMDHASFRPAFDRLADLAQLIYLDHSGQGRSDPTPRDRWVLDAWADDVVAFCDALSLEQPVILGWSFGGMVAMNLASRRPDRLSKLIIQSSAARMDLDRICGAFERLGDTGHADCARRFWTTPSADAMAEYMARCMPLYSPGPIDTDAMQRMIMTPELLQGGWREALTFDQTAALARVTVPTLVLTGELDPITPPAASEEIVAHLTSAPVDFERFPRSGHFLHESEGERFFEVVERFIRA